MAAAPAHFGDQLQHILFAHLLAEMKARADDGRQEIDCFAFEGGADGV
jgi:hypothetical protein